MIHEESLWSFDDRLFIFDAWCQDDPINDHYPHFHDDLGTNMSSYEFGLQIGYNIEEVIFVEWRETFPLNIGFLRVRVCIDLGRPLLIHRIDGSQVREKNGVKKSPSPH